MNLINFFLSPKRIVFFVFASVVFTGFILINASKVHVFAASGINSTINFQGKVVNSNGTNVADGQYTFVFTLYDAASAGSNLWTETQSNVTVTGGIFRVSLGSVNSLSVVNFNSDSIYLGINFNSDGEMTPRIRFASVPYAFNAQQVNGLTVENTSNNPFSSTTTLKIADGKTVVVNNGLTFSGTDSTTFTFPSTGGNIVTESFSQTLTSKTIGSTGLTFAGATTDITTGTNEVLTLAANGTGNVLVQSGSGGQAAFVVDKTGLGDIFSASSSGVPKFTIKSDGTASSSAGFTIDGAGNLRTTNAQTLTLGGSTTGSIVLQPNGDAANRLLVSSNGSAISLKTTSASNLNIDTGGAAALNLGTTNATSVVLGSSALTSFTITTNGTGDTAVSLPAQSIGSSEILNNTIDYTKISDTPTLDAATALALSTFNYTLNLSSTGDFLIQDAGNSFAQFLDDGTITLGKAASSSTINIGIGTGADTINIGTDSTVGDTLALGNNNSGTTLSVTGGTAWSVTTAGAATLTSLTGAGLTDCDAATSKLLWNDATGTFSCGTDLGSNLQVVTFTDTTTELASFTSAVDIWDGTYPHITPGSTNSKILISVNIRGTSDDANDQNPVFQIHRAIGTNPTCTDTNVGGEFVGTFLTAATQDWGASVTFGDAPSSTGDVRYTVCTTTTGADDGNTDEVRFTLTEIGSSSGGGGGGNISVRESDTSPSVATVTTLEFGPATTSSDEFIVTDEGGGVARVRIGDQVGVLNQAETVTGGWTFDTGNTTFTTAANFNGGLTTSTTNQNLAFSANGSGDFVFSIDNDTGVSIGTSSNTPAPLSVAGGIGSNAAFVLNQLNNGDLIAASYSGTNKFRVDNSGNVTASGGINLSTGNIAFTSTGNISLAGGNISDSAGNLNLNDDVTVSGNVTATGSTGLTLSGAGSSLTLVNNESISNATDGTITFGRNDAGTVILTAKDNDATAALSIVSGGASNLTLDTGGAATLGIGTSQATTINIGNNTSTTTINLTKGASGNIVLTGFNCSTLTNGGVLTTDSSGNIQCQNDDGGAATSTYWNSSLGALYPNNSTYDFFIGGVSTSSAKFAVTGVNNDAPVATISASSGYALSLNSNGSITTTKGKSLTLGGGDSGEVYVSSILHIDPTNGIRGGGLSDCSNATTSKLLWDASTNRFSCGTDQGGGGGSSITVRESDSSPAVSAVAVIEFGPGTTSSDEFTVTDEGGGVARINLGTKVGMLNQAETVTGGWTFDTGNTTFTTAVNLNGGLTTTTTNQNLAFSANGSGDFVFTVDSDTNVSLTGGTDGTDAMNISAGNLTLGDGDLNVNGGDFNVTLDAGDTLNVAKSGASAGDVIGVSASSVNSIDGIQLDLTSTSDAAADTYNGINFTWTESSDADIVNAINIGNTTSTNSTATGIVIGTGWDTGILVNSGGVSIAGGGLTVSSGGIAVNGGNITSTQSTLTIDAGGTVSIADNLTVTGTTGLTLSGTGADLIFANNESITNDTDGTITFHRNDAGTVTLSATDNDATAALTIQSGGAAALSLDAGGAAGVSIGTGNANSITVGNTSASYTLNVGTGGVNIGDNANTKAIEIGGVDSDGADTVRIATNATSADAINIGNANASTTMALTGGTSWSVTTAGAATFGTLSGAGLSSCNSSTAKLLWNSGSFSCGTDLAGADSQMASATLSETTLANTSTFLNTVSITPTTATGDIFVRANIWTKSASNTDQTITIEIRTGSGSTCGGSLLASGTAALNSGSNTNGPNASAVYFVADAGASLKTYAICALSSSNSGASAGGIASAEVIDSGADLAEFYTTNDSSITAGDIVSIDPALSSGVLKTTRSYDGQILGIVSTLPALAIGNVTKEGVAGVPVALSGRVPVKATNENGPIKAGDYLTSSSAPGVAMKATKAGPVIGVAMHDFDSSSGTVLTFVKSGYYTGTSLMNEDGIAVSRPTSNAILDDFINNPASNSADFSEVVTDRVVAGIEVVSPKIVTQAVELEKISARKGLIEVDLGENGSLVIKDGKGEKSVVIDNNGNADFKGTVTADKIVANKIQGLEYIVSDLVATNSAKLSIEESLNSLKTQQENLTSQMASVSAQLYRMGSISLLGGNDTYLTSISNLAVSGTSTLSQVSILDSLTIGTGSTISISSNAINTVGHDLSLQNLKQGAVDFLAGAIRFETDGTAVFSENVLFKKDVSVEGVLSAQTVKATDITFGDGQPTQISDDEFEATSAAGLITLKKDHESVRVNNPRVTGTSYIFITPKTSTSRTLFLLEQSEAKDNEKAHFTVGIDRAYNEDVKFNYLIVN